MLVQNCPECGKVGATTECQYMEFPAGVHHYFGEKVCTFHFWLLYVRPKRSWEEYLKLEKTHSESAGYILTLPSDELIKAALAGGALPKVEAPSPQSPASSEAKPASAGEASAGAPTQQPTSA